MATHGALVTWQRDGQVFSDNRYSRRHLVRFDGGAELAASSSPHVVPVPMSDAAAADPEELFVASLASCHMLWFLSIAVQRQLVVDHYEDDAIGVLGKDAGGKLSMTRVTLRPQVRFAGEHPPTPAELTQLHHEAHEACFIANSVRTEVRCEPRH